MFYKIIFLLLFSFSFLKADIIEIEHIEDIKPYIVEKALCLFDIDDTLIDNPFSLGSPPWRNWVKSKLPKGKTAFELFDALTLYIAQHAPYKAVEPTTAAFIKELQEEKVVVLGFTARGRSEWYSTTIDGVDRFTQEQLKKAGIDLSQSEVPQELQGLNPAHYFKGIIFAKHIPKGKVLESLTQDLDYSPPLILFIDDKREQVESVEASLKDLGLPFLGFWYKRSALDRAHFDPAIANMQLEFLLFQDTILSDEEALSLAPKENPVYYLEKILNSYKTENLSPNIK